ncbi:MAG: dihydropteroate synthase [Deltaproteobacteria bacterium]|nr:dihydropteroate synthase [Deltaproteobacteria bacterium]
MGILNVTPDSFSDGGEYKAFDAAVAHGERMARHGADLIDVGGESTRPGAPTVDEAEEIDRVVPVIRELARRIPAVPICVDTTKPAVAEAALEAGAAIVNDISGLDRAPEFADIAARHGAGLVVMHMRGTPADMQTRANYEDVVADILAHWRRALDLARAAGVKDEAVVVDPGIGFAKTFAHNLEILGRLGELAAFGRPVMIGLSRKSFLGRITGADARDRDPETVAATLVAASRGAHIHRVHDVAGACRALRVWTALHARGTDPA